MQHIVNNKLVKFLYHPSVTNESLGVEFKQRTEKWSKGALNQLMKMLDSNSSDCVPQFKRGTQFHSRTLGNVWFDTELTGDNCTMKVRVTPVMKDKDTGVWHIVLDNTFDAERQMENEALSVMKNLKLLPKNTGLLITDETISLVKGPFDGETIKTLVECSFFEMYSILDGKFELWFDEEGMKNKKKNELATRKLHKLFGGELFGNVLVVNEGTVP